MRDGDYKIIGIESVIYDWMSHDRIFYFDDWIFHVSISDEDPRVIVPKYASVLVRYIVVYK